MHFLSINSIMEKVGLGKFSGSCLLDGLTFETQENLHSKELLNTQKHIVKNIRRYRRGCQARGSQGSSTTSSSPEEPFQLFRILIFISPPPTSAQRQTGCCQTQSRPEKRKKSQKFAEKIRILTWTSSLTQFPSLLSLLTDT